MSLNRIFFIAVFVLVFEPLVVRAETEDPPISWFSGFALGGEGGAAWLETSTSDGFSLKPTVGGRLYLDVLTSGPHAVVLDTGYLYLVGSNRNGTQEVFVSTSYQRVDAAIGYDFRYKLLVVGGRAGAAGMILSTSTELRDASFEVVGGQLVFHEGQVIESRRDTGVDFGFMGRVEVGLDLTRLFGGPSSVSEFRLRGELVRRGEREEFFAGAAVVFRPTSLFL